jgi:glycerol kinase
VLYPTEKSINVPGLIHSLADNTSSHRLHLLEGTVNGAGSALNWAKDRLGLSSDQPDDVLSMRREDSERLIFINSVSGLGSPFWRTDIDPHWIDVNAKQVEHPDSDVALLAVYESILFLVNANLQQMLEHGCEIDQIEISGGLSRTSDLCQRLADLTQRPVTQRMNAEATTRGIAWLAAVSPETWEMETEWRFEPAMDNQLQLRYQRFMDILRNL